MSRQDLKRIRDKSVDLCQLIIKRTKYDEISQEIRELVQNGANINFQLASSTPLHLAIENNDVKCVEFLLTFKPDLDIKNDEEETPKAFARNLGYNEIVKKIEQNGEIKFASIKKTFIREVAFNELKHLTTDGCFKILKILNCPMIEDVFIELQNCRFVSTLEMTSHLFVIVIQSSEGSLKSLESICTALSSTFGTQRPLIIQLNLANNKPEIYFKEPGSGKFGSENLRPETDSMALIDSEEHFNFQIVIKALRSQIIGKFKGDLLEAELTENEMTHKIIKLAANRNVLCLRFLKLFDLSQDDRSSFSMLFETMKYEGLDNVLTALDIPFTLSKLQDLILTREQRKQLKALDERGFNILMIAVECNNVEAVQFLIKARSDLIHVVIDGKTASDLAWECKHYECVVELICADSNFPTGFNFNDIIASETALIKLLGEPILTKARFHKIIQSGSVEGLKVFLMNQSQLKFVYDISNKSALSIALEAKQVEVYSYLRSAGFCYGIDERRHDEIMKDLSDYLREAIRINNKKYFPSPVDSHLFHIVSKSKLGFNNCEVKNNKEVIKNMFDELDEIQGVHEILKTLNKQEFEIIFDFNNSSVKDSDPTEDGHTMGVAYNTIRDIYVAAKASQDYTSANILGTLAHELTHYVMELIYNNNDNPYEVKDEATRKRFETIVEALHNEFLSNPDSMDPIIKNVFECYGKEIWHCELIVRVPELLATYKNDPSTLTNIKETYCKELFKFFDEVTLKDVKERRKLIQPKNEIRQLNNSIGFLEKIELYPVFLNGNVMKNYKDLFIDKSKRSLKVSSNTPMLALALIYELLYLDHPSYVDTFNIFAESSNFCSKSTQFENITKAFKLSVKPFIIIYISQSINDDESKGLLEFLKQSNERIILVMLNKTMEKLKTGLNELKSLDLSFSWKDLASESKKKLLARLIEFQGQTVPLSELMNLNSSACNELPLYEITSSQEMIIKEPDIQHKFQNFYVERSFLAPESVDSGGRYKTRKVVFVPKSLDEILNYGEKDKIMLISGVAGAGKSTSLFQISKELKSKNPTSWVSFIDLKQHIRVFKQLMLKYSRWTQSFQEFLSQIIFETRNSFDKLIFNELYQKGNAIILMDGFDKISPNFNDFIMSVLTAFDKQSGNQLWITTRSHIKKDLEETLNISSYKIAPLKSDDQVAFLVKFWTEKSQSEVLTTDSHNSFEEAAKNLIDRVKETIKYNSNRLVFSDLIGIPLQVRMVAEIYDEKSALSDDPINFLYKSFIEKSIEKWLREQGDLAIKDQKQVLSRESVSLFKVHEQIALKYFFDVEPDFDRELWTHEKISRIGLIDFDVDANNFEFIHETFAEYFLAEFAVANLNVVDKRSLEWVGKVFMEIRFRMVRIFVDDLLHDHKNDSTAFNAHLKSIIEENGRRDILAKVILNRHENLFNLIFETFETLSESRCKEILNHLEWGENVLMLAVRYKKIFFFEKVLNFMKQKLTKSDLADILQAKWLQDKVNPRGTNLLELAVCVDASTELTSRILDELKEISTSTQNKQILLKKQTHKDLNLLCWAVSINKNLELIDVLCNFAVDVFEPDEFRNYLFETDKTGKNVLQIAASRIQEINFESLFMIFKSHLTLDDQNSLLSHKDNSGENIFHCFHSFSKNERIISNLLNVVKYILQPHEIADMLKENYLQGYNKGRTIFYCMIEVMKSAEIFEETLLILKQVLDREDCKFMLLQKPSNEVQNLLCFSASQKKNSKFIEVLWKFAADVLEPEELRSFLFGTDSDGKNVLQIAISYNSDFDLESLFTAFIRRLSPVDQNSLLRHKDISGRNIFSIIFPTHLHYSCEPIKNERIFVNVLNVLKTVSDSTVITEMLLEKKLHAESFLHLMVARAKSHEIFTEIFDILQKVLTREDQKQILSQRTLYADENLLCLAVRENKSLKCIEVLWKFAVGAFDSAELHDYLFDKGRTNVLKIAASKSEVNLESLFMMFKIHLSLDDQRTLLSHKDFGTNIFQCVSSHCKNEKIFKELLTIMQSVFVHPEITTMLLDRRCFGGTFFHTIIEVVKCEELFRETSNILQTVISRYYLKLILQQSCLNKTPNMLCFAVSIGKQIKFLKVLLDLAVDLFEPIELNHFLLAIDINGRNVLQIAEPWNDEIDIKSLFMIFKSHLNNDDQKKMLRHRDNCGQNIFLCVPSYFVNEIIFIELLSIMKTVLNPFEILAMLLEKNSRGENVLFKMLVVNDDGSSFSMLPRSRKKTSFDDVKVFEGTLFLFQQILSKENQKVILRLKQTADELNSLCLAVSNKKKTLELIEALWKFAVHAFESEELRNFVLETDAAGANVFQIAASKNSRIGVESLFKMVGSHLTKEDQQNMLRHKDNSGKNIFLCVPNYFENERIFIELLSMMKTVLDSSEILAMLSEKNSRGENVLHKIAIVDDDDGKRFSGFVQVFEETLSILQQILSREEQKQMLKEKQTDDELNLLCLAVSKNKNKEFTDVLWKLAVDVFEPAELKHYLLETDRTGRNVFQIAESIDIKLAFNNDS